MTQLIKIFPLGSTHGSRQNKTVNLQQVVPLKEGKNHVALLSVMVGLPVVTFSLRILLNRLFGVCVCVLYPLMHSFMLKGFRSISREKDGWTD